MTDEVRILSAHPRVAATGRPAQYAEGGSEQVQKRSARGKPSIQYGGYLRVCFNGVRGERMVRSVVRFCCDHAVSRLGDGRQERGPPGSATTVDEIAHSTGCLLRLPIELGAEVSLPVDQTRGSVTDAEITASGRVSWFTCPVRHADDQMTGSTGVGVGQRRTTIVAGIATLQRGTANVDHVSGTSFRPRAPNPWYHQDYVGDHRLPALPGERRAATNYGNY